METTVIMKRRLFEGEVSQNSKNGFLLANDLIVYGNQWRNKNAMPLVTLASWMGTQQTKEFINELEQQFGTVLETKRGKKGGTWMHPYLFIDLALAISPKLKIEVYKWLYDELLKYRNDSGDSYKRMAGALWDRTNSKSTFPRDIAKLAVVIKNECGVNDWQTATEEQLKFRDKIQDNIALLCDVMNNTKEAIRLAIYKAKNPR